MRKVLIVFLAVFCIQFAYTAESEKKNVYVSIMPQKYFAEKVGGDLVNVSVLVPSGASPENFDPSPRQIVQLGSSDVYFTIGIPFENIFMDKLKSGKKKLIVADCSKDVPKLKNPEHDEHDEDEAEEDHEHHHHHGEYDPHIWTDPVLVRTIARNMADTLISIDPEHTSVYTENRNKFIHELDTLQEELKQVLSPYKGRVFYVYHSAYTYFANRFGLVQKAIETGEKEPAPAKLRELVNQAKNDSVKTIFIQPEFPASGAKRVAEAIGGKTVTMSVLEYNWAENMRRTASLLAESFKE